MDPQPELPEPEQPSPTEKLENDVVSDPSNAAVEDSSRKRKAEDEDAPLVNDAKRVATDTVHDPEVGTSQAIELPPDQKNAASVVASSVELKAEETIDPTQSSAPPATDLSATDRPSQDGTAPKEPPLDDTVESKDKRDEIPVTSVNETSMEAMDTETTDAVASSADADAPTSGATASSPQAPTLLEPIMTLPLVSPSNRHKASYDNIKWVTVTNDGSPDSMVKLIGLKSLFAKQLPKMPRAYIARLVLDRRHTSLAILSDNPHVQGSDEEIIGGICYRAFADMRFAEIAFCAVNATHQVKGYGTKLMNLLKQTAARTGIEFFITYADNYAIGYFKKQGFTKQITMPKGRYYGLIKDYDGGTPMECYVHPSIDYCRVPALIAAQRDFILSRVAQTTGHSLTVYPPLPTLVGTSSTLTDAGGTVSRGQWAATQALSVPGVLDAGWTLADLIQASVAKGGANGTDDSGMRQKSGALKQELLGLVRRLEEQQFAWPFREPVDPSEVPDYLDVVVNPIDLKTMAARIRHDNYYKNKQMLFADVMLMVENCKLYNEDGSTYIQCAVSLEKFARTLFHDILAAPNNALPHANATT